MIGLLVAVLACLNPVLWQPSECDSLHDTLCLGDLILTRY